MKSSLDLLIFLWWIADLTPFLTSLCKKAFLSRTERFGSVLFCIFYSNLGLPSAKSLQNGCLGSLLSRRKIKPVTTHKMASHLMDMNIIFQENMCLTDLHHYKHFKMAIFEYASTQERIGTVFSGVQPIMIS